MFERGNCPGEQTNVQLLSRESRLGQCISVAVHDLCPQSSYTHAWLVGESSYGKARLHSFPHRSKDRANKTPGTQQSPRAACIHCGTSRQCSRRGLCDLSGSGAAYAGLNYPQAGY